MFEKFFVSIFAKNTCLHNLNFTHDGVSPVDEANSFPDKARKVYYLPFNFL